MKILHVKHFVFDFFFYSSPLVRVNSLETPFIWTHLLCRLQQKEHKTFNKCLILLTPTMINEYKFSYFSGSINKNSAKILLSHRLITAGALLKIIHINLFHAFTLCKYFQIFFSSFFIYFEKCMHNSENYFLKSDQQTSKWIIREELNGLD